MNAAMTAAMTAASDEELKQSMDNNLDNNLVGGEQKRLTTALGVGKGREVAKIVCEALQDKGWRGIPPHDVTAEQLDDKQVYKVTAVSASPPTVILKFRGGAPVTLKERKTEAAAKAFGAAGVSPGRLVEGEEWHIEHWIGVTLFDGSPSAEDGTFDPTDAAQVEKVLQAAVGLGRLAARIHSVPTDWFQPFREEDVKAHPVLGALCDTNFLWLYQYWRQGAGNDALAREAGLSIDFDETMRRHAKDPEPLKKILAAIPKPRCPALSRVVTCHGDLWCCNVLRSPKPEEGLFACDVESACAMPALWDWMHGQIGYFEKETELLHESNGGEGPSFARAMVEAYLKELGEPCGKDEVDAAVFDIRSFTDTMYIREFMDVVYAGWDKINLAYVEEFAARMRTNWDDPRLRKAVLDEPHLSPSSYLTDLNEHLNAIKPGPYARGDA